MDMESGLDWLVPGLTISRDEIRRRFEAGWSLRQELGHWSEWVRPDGGRQPAETYLSLMA